MSKASITQTCQNVKFKKASDRWGGLGAAKANVLIEILD